MNRWTFALAFLILAGGLLAPTCERSYRVTAERPDTGTLCTLILHDPETGRVVDRRRLHCDDEDFLDVESAQRPAQR